MRPDTRRHLLPHGSRQHDAGFGGPLEKDVYMRRLYLLLACASLFLGSAAAASAQGQPRLFYTPAGSKYDDMTVSARFAPNKNSGQGFGSATEQFLDVYIKYDLATNTGYGLRIQRLTTEEINAGSSDFAVGRNPAVAS